MQQQPSRHVRINQSPAASVHKALYRGRQVAGMVILGGIVVAFALARASWAQVFPTGWWNVW